MKSTTDEGVRKHGHKLEQISFSGMVNAVAGHGLVKDAVFFVLMFHTV